MTGEQALSEREIFQAAVQLPAAERATYLDEACGDNIALRAEVESLLEAHDTAKSFLEHPAIQISPPHSAVESNFRSPPALRIMQMLALAFRLEGGGPFTALRI